MINTGARAVNLYDDPILNSIASAYGAAGGNSAEGRLMAAADYSGPGALEIPKFETEIVDLIRRESNVLNRIKPKPASGHPHRYFEQTGIATATSADPRNLSATPSGPTRQERVAYIKATIAQSNLSLFDRDVTEQQGQFEQLEAKDIKDILNAIIVARAQMFWTGTDASLMIPTSYEWVGALEQVSLQATIPLGSSIIDGLKTQVAQMVADTAHSAEYKPRPTAIYMNPMLIDKIEKEAKASHIDLGTMNITAGVEVKFLATQAGRLPLIDDAYILSDTSGKYGFSAPPAGYNNYYAFITTEDLIEIPYIGKSSNGAPRIFQLGLTGNLAGQFVGVQFDALVVKAYGYAHAVVAVQGS